MSSAHSNLQFVLGSASPGRLKTLQAAGVNPHVVVSEVDEEAILKNAAQAEQISGTMQVQVLAHAKALAVAKKIMHCPTHYQLNPQQPILVLGCDTMLERSVVASDGQTSFEMLGKPSTHAEAKSKWLMLRNQKAILRTGHCLMLLTRSATASAESISLSASDWNVTELTESTATVIHFGCPNEAEMDAYIQCGEPIHVAGGFTIDGLGGWFITGIEGDPHSVVGVSLPLLHRLLPQLGFDITDLWSI